MSSSPTRRDFLSIGLGALPLLPAVTRAEAMLPPDKVRFGRDIEPLVRLLEDSPRARLLEEVAAQIKKGVGYQQWLTALMLAGVRGIQPRPVGFKFHAVLVVNSAHMASLAGPDSDRWLPLLWAMDNYKASQARNKTEGDWSMSAVDEAALPKPGQAAKRFHEAMDDWDVEAADRAVVGFARNAGAIEVIEAFWRYGARDFRDIGHKAIYVANAWRTLQTIGWRHAEPVLRSLAYALLEHEGSNPAKRDGDPDRPWRENIARVGRIGANWQQGQPSASATQDLLRGLRQESASDASGQVIGLLAEGVHPSSLWDGIILRAGELLMQQPGIIGLHCVTSVNALHYAFESARNEETRKMMLLQAAAFLALFRARMTGGKMRTDLQVDELSGVTPRGKGEAAIEEIASEISSNKESAARKTLAALQTGAVGPEALMTAARRLIFAKGTDSHDYKFSSAALEDYYFVSEAMRPRYLAASVFWLKGSQDRDNPLIARAKAAIG